jgi:hypothetical protein
MILNLMNIKKEEMKKNKLHLHNYVINIYST